MSLPSFSTPMTSPHPLENALLDVAASDRKAALRTAAAMVAAAHALDVTLVFDALWRREQAGSTALGHGFAVPHARISGIASPLTVYLRTRRPIDFDAADGRPVSHLLVILVPIDGDHEDHLRMLAHVAGLVADRTSRERLCDATDPHEAAAAFMTGIERSFVVD